MFKINILHTEASSSTHTGIIVKQKHKHSARQPCSASQPVNACLYSEFNRETRPLQDKWSKMKEQ